MTFLSAGRLWLLVAVAALVVGYVVSQFRADKYAVRFSNLPLLASVAPKRPGWRRHLPAAAFALALVTFVLAFAQPTRNTRVPREEATIVMAVDVSLSMQATDVEPSRLEAAKAAAASFVDLVPAKLNIGLVSFSGTAQVLVAPTTDHSLLKRNIANLQLGPATAIGEAIYASLGAVASVPTQPGKKPPPARIVLMSDGATTVGRPNESAVQAAVDAQTPVSTIAFGTDTGTVFVEGSQVRVPVNKDALRTIADETKGSFFEASSAKELKKVYADIGSSVGYRTVRKEATSLFVGLGLAFALVAAATSLAWFSRLP
ncbi:MAG TPA: VWA domain-containing protein [Acidimicrobiales bacterium]|nr:VWA domain-containing protein [Acidimicrobiales bacterium]